MQVILVGFVFAYSPGVNLLSGVMSVLSLLQIQVGTSSEREIYAIFLDG